ncbi:universal stress protein [Nocardioides sp. Root151]|uniref:universal stress protein n=1 Tax=Nocardioides sp. Root151 TaxID=1736475 RepID=UPI0009E987D5|nr:universal stress protein [Nocardioides sp. Root151]
MTAPAWQSRPVAWTDPTRAIVVGVDASPSNAAAVDYAAHDATATGRDLVLVVAVDDSVIPVPHHDVRFDTSHEWQLLHETERRLRADHPDLTVHHEVRFGGAAHCLLDRSVEQARLVVGKRGLGTFSRMLAGSTSIAVAGRSRVPVFVVPPAWEQAAHEHDKVLVGIDPDEGSETALRFAFTEAARRGVRLEVLHSVDIEPILVWDPQLGGPTYREWQERGAGSVERTVKPLRDEFPDVEVELTHKVGHPGTALLDAAARAQLLVLGRRRNGRFGLELGSVARGVLHHSETPVVVVPSH